MEPIKRPGMQMRHRPKTKQSLRLRIKLSLIISAGASLVAVIAFIMFGSVGAPEIAKGANYQILDSGSYIVNMGVTPQSISNGLKPYGLVYDLVVNYDTPVKWIIEPTKAKDGTDFTYNSVAYKGGPFIIPAEYITATIKSRITYWQGQGVQGLYTNSKVTVPVYSDLTCLPRITIDNLSNNQTIVQGYFINAGIPSTAYSYGPPVNLTTCHDLWVNPHGDPTWSTHGRLYSFATTEGSFIWSQCHAVSVMEDCANPSSPFQQLNFLTLNGLKCYSSGKCSPGSTETHGGNSTTPYFHNYPDDPMMQFMGTMSAAAQGGSEDWYQPNSTGGWRPTTKRLVITSDGASPNEGILMAYGPAYGNTNNGYVMYESGHDLDKNGAVADRVAAQRAFFNFMLFAGIKKAIIISSINVPSIIASSQQKPMSLVATSPNPSMSYQWSCSVAGGTFDAPTNASTNYTAPVVMAQTNAIITCRVTDGCGRKNFMTRHVVINVNALPVSLTSFRAEPNESGASINWTTATEINNKFFQLSRSADGTHFETITQIPGAGTIHAPKNYSYTDRNLQGGTYYYQLKQVDYDGRSETFRPVTVNIKGDQSAFSLKRVWPNPFSSYCNLEIQSDQSQTVTMSLCDLSGKIIKSQETEINEGGNMLRFDADEPYPAGIYILMIMADGKLLASQKVIRQ